MFSYVACVSVCYWSIRSLNVHNRIAGHFLLQNCVSGCRTGVLEGGIVEDTDPDVDCYKGTMVCYSGYCDIESQIHLRLICITSYSTLKKI